MPANYSIPNVNDVSGVCPHCEGTGCQYCRKMTCPDCNGIIRGSGGCPTCLGTKHEFNSDLIQHHHVTLPDPGTRPYAGERPPAAPRIIMGRRR